MVVTNSVLKFHLRNTTKQIYLGVVENRTVAYVDWDSALSLQWLGNMTVTLAEINADGILIQNNVFRDDYSETTPQLDEELYRYLPQVMMPLLFLVCYKYLILFSPIEFRCDSERPNSAVDHAIRKR